MKFSTFAVLSALATVCVNSHGGMQWPPSRNVLHTNYCPHCANGSGVCGDVGGQWVSSSEPSKTYGSYFDLQRPILIAGGKLEVEIWFTVGHLGIFTMELCQSPPSDTLTESCFVRLNRDPTDTAVSPYIAEVPHIFFLPDNSCILQASQANPLKARFIIPEGTETSHAVVRYRWSTGNSCSPSAYSTSSTLDSRISSWRVNFNGASSQCGVAISGLSSCGTDCPNSNCGGERFTNCADVAIASGSSSTVVSRSSHSTTSEQPGTAITSPPGVSTTTKSAGSTTSTTTAVSTTKAHTVEYTGEVQSCTPGGAIVGNASVCRNRIASFGAFDDYCKGLCATFASGAEVTGIAWCQAKRICDLAECVATFWSNVCRLV